MDDNSNNAIYVGLGILVSILLGVVAGLIKSDVAFGFLVCVQCQILALLLIIFKRDIYFRIFISRELAEAIELAKLADRIHSIEDPIVTSKFRWLLDELRELASGRYELSTLEDVYLDDTESIRNLNSGDTLRSTCPLARAPDKIKEQLNDRFFRMSIDEHIEASKRSVKVVRIYLIANKKLLNDVPELTNHLNKLDKEKIKVHLIFEDEPAFKRAKNIPDDFLIFNDHKVSIGKISRDEGIVSGARIETTPIVVERHSNFFKTLVNISEDLTCLQLSIDKNNIQLQSSIKATGQ